MSPRRRRRSGARRGRRAPPARRDVPRFGQPARTSAQEAAASEVNTGRETAPAQARVRRLSSKRRATRTTRVVPLIAPAQLARRKDRPCRRPWRPCSGLGHGPAGGDDPGHLHRQLPSDTLRLAGDLLTDHLDVVRSEADGRDVGDDLSVPTGMGPQALEPGEGSLAPGRRTADALPGHRRRHGARRRRRRGRQRQADRQQRVGGVVREELAIRRQHRDSDRRRRRRRHYGRSVAAPPHPREPAAARARLHARKGHLRSDEGRRRRPRSADAQPRRGRPRRGEERARGSLRRDRP